MPAPDLVFRIRPADWRQDEAAIARVRRTVFIDEQGVPEHLEWEDEDATCLWWLGEVDGAIVATVRLLPSGRIGRMAVLRPWRGRGIGHALLAAAVAAAYAAGLTTVQLSAQTHAIPFYARAGFQAQGPEYLDAGIPHRTMYRELMT